MDNRKRMARNIVRSLIAAIHEYQYHHDGEYPIKIFAEADAYFALQLECYGYAVRIFEREMTFAHIPVERISKMGTGIYLSGEPVQIYDLPDGDVQFVFRKEKDDGKT